MPASAAASCGTDPGAPEARSPVRRPGRLLVQWRWERAFHEYYPARARCRRAAGSAWFLVTAIHRSYGHDFPSALRRKRIRKATSSDSSRSTRRARDDRVAAMSGSEVVEPSKTTHNRLRMATEASVGRPMPDGRKPAPGGWNHIHLIVDDVVTGPAGLQILLAQEFSAGPSRSRDPPPRPTPGEPSARSFRGGHPSGDDYWFATQHDGITPIDEFVCVWSQVVHDDTQQLLTYVGARCAEQPVIPRDYAAHN